MSNIKFSAQEDWTVTDLQNFFHQLNILYNRLYVIDDLNPDSKAKLTNILNTSLSRVPEYDQLLVGYIEIHSQAKFSLKGGDKIIGQLRGLIIDIWFSNKLEKKKKEQELEHQGKVQQLEVAHQEKLNDLEIADKHTDLIKKQIGSMRDAGYSDEDIQKNIKKLTNPVKKISSIMYEKDVKLLNLIIHITRPCNLTPQPVTLCAYRTKTRQVATQLMAALLCIIKFNQVRWH